MKKYNIIISHTDNDLYTVILKVFELSEQKEEINVQSIIKTNQTLIQCIELQNRFING